MTPPPSSGDDPQYDSAVTVSVSIHDTGATISVPDTVENGYTLYAYQDEDCDIDDFDNCDEGEVHSLSAGTPSVEVTALTTTQTAYFTLQNKNSGVSRSFTIEPSPPFPARAGHQVVVFDNKLWLIVFSSPDHELGLCIRRVIEPLKNQRLEHDDRIESRSPAAPRNGILTMI